MALVIQTVLIGLLVSVCSASPARLEKLTPSKSKFLARQKAAEDIPAQTPYPPAGIRPEVSFNLPTEEQDEVAAPAVTSGKVIAPADYYLPPVFEASKFSAPAEVYGPPAEVYGQPAETYGPPEVSPKDENSQVGKDDAQPEEALPEQTQQDDVLPEEIQPEEVESSSSSKPVEEELEVEAEQEQEVPDDARVEIAGEANNELLGRIVLAKKSDDKKSGKLQALQPISAQQFFLIDGKLYSVRG